MELNYDELLCFNSITKGPSLFATKIQRLPGSNEEILKRTQESLRKKNILDENNHLTQWGGIVVRYYEIFRNNKTHILLNHMRIAPLENGECIFLYPCENGYDMQCLDPAKILVRILYESSYLKKAEVSQERGTWQSYEYDDLSAYVDQNAKGSLVIGEYEGFRAVKERVFYWTEEDGFVYNIQRERQRSMSPGEMRKELLKVLRLWERQDELKRILQEGAQGR